MRRAWNEKRTCTVIGTLIYLLYGIGDGRWHGLPRISPTGWGADHVADVKPGEKSDQMCKMWNRHRKANERMEHATQGRQRASSSRKTLRLPTMWQDVQGRRQAHHREPHRSLAWLRNPSFFLLAFSSGGLTRRCFSLFNFVHLMNCRDGGFSS